jgi:hypothetical protein
VARGWLAGWRETEVGTWLVGWLEGDGEQIILISSKIESMKITLWVLFLS